MTQELKTNTSSYNPTSGLLLANLEANRSSQVRLWNHSDARFVKDDLRYLWPLMQSDHAEKTADIFYLGSATKETISAEDSALRRLHDYVGEYGNSGLVIVEGVDFSRANNDHNRVRLAKYLTSIINQEDDTPMQLVFGVGSRPQMPEATTKVSATQTYLSHIASSFAYKTVAGQDMLVEESIAAPSSRVSHIATTDQWQAPNVISDELSLLSLQRVGL